MSIGVAKNEPEIAVELRGVKKSFEGKKVHCGVDLRVREGEIMTLVGGSGQGAVKPRDQVWGTRISGGSARIARMRKSLIHQASSKSGVQAKERRLVSASNRCKHR